MRPCRLPLHFDRLLDDFEVFLAFASGGVRRLDLGRGTWRPHLRPVEYDVPVIVIVQGVLVGRGAVQVFQLIVQLACVDGAAPILQGVRPLLNESFRFREHASIGLHVVRIGDGDAALRGERILLKVFLRVLVMVLASVALLCGYTLSVLAGRLT